MNVKNLISTALLLAFYQLAIAQSTYINADSVVIFDNNDTARVFIFGGSQSNGLIPEMRIVGDTVQVVLIGEEGIEQLQLFLKSDKSGLVLSNSSGESVAQLITSSDGKTGILALDNDNQVTSILASGGSDSLGTKPEIKVRGDTAYFYMVNGIGTEKVKLFMESNKSGLVISNPDGASVAQLISSTDGNSGILALDNDNQVPSIIAFGGSDSLGTKPEIKITGDTSSFLMNNSLGNERMKLFTRGDKSGMVISNIDGQSVAQLTTSNDGESGLFSLENDNQLTTVLAFGGSGFDEINPSLTIKSSDSKLSLDKDTVSHLSLEMIGGNPFFKMVDVNQNRVAEIRPTLTGNGDFFLYKNDEPYIQTFGFLPEPWLFLRNSHILLSSGILKYATLGKDVNGGRLELFDIDDSLNLRKAFMGVFPLGFGGGIMHGANNSFNIYMDAVFGNPNNGWFSVHDQNGNSRASVYSNTFVGGAGVCSTLGPNGSLNTFTGPPTGLDNHGAYAVFDANSNIKGEMVISPVSAGGKGIVQSEIIRTLDLKASMFTNAGQGIIQADVKNFSMPHPLLADKRIVYACIEGPEAAAYARGTAQLQNGRATIELPDHFRLVASEEGMTVILTPISIESKGLAVVRKSLNGIEVGEMFDGKGNYAFDWEVKSIRKGYENYEVIRDNDEPHLQKFHHEYKNQAGEGSSSKE